MFQLITASKIQPTKAHRFLVELASNDLELDAYGEAVPKNFKTLDVVVSEPTKEAITTLLQVAGHLDNWGIVSHWIPEDCDCF